MTNSLKHKALYGVLWRIIEQGGKQLINFVISVILARLIVPEQFGLITIVMVFTAIANVFIDSGFSTALIRKNDRTDVDCSTVYWFNLVIALICYIIIFILAPFISDFYQMGELTSLLRVSSIGFVIGAFVGVQRTLLHAELNFKLLTKFNLLGMIISGGIGILLAFLDFKAWALVFQVLTMNLITTICIWFKVEWKPKFIFSKQSFHEFFGFGSKILASSLLDTIYNNIYTIVIGKIYKPSYLAFYNKASNLSAMTSSMPSTIIHSVMYPALCKLQKDENALKQGYIRILRLTSFIVFPACLGIGAVAYPLINVVYTDTWIYVATLLSIISFAQMWIPIHLINLSYLEVIGRSDLFFRLEVIKKIQGAIILIVTAPIGLEAMCYGYVVSSILSLIWNTYYTGKFLKLSILTQLKDILPSLILSIVMFIAARCVANYLGNNILSLICSISFGVIVYISGAFIFKFTQIDELKNIRH